MWRPGSMAEVTFSVSKVMHKVSLLQGIGGKTQGTLIFSTSIKNAELEPGVTVSGKLRDRRIGKSLKEDGSGGLDKDKEIVRATFLWYR